MKKLLFSAVALIASSFAFGQITLDHSFVNEEALSYITPTETFYVSRTSDNKIKIYNADYSLYKTVNIPFPANFDKIRFASDEYNKFVISKNIFNTDSKLEFLIGVSNSVTQTDMRLLLINEDGALLKDFHAGANVNYAQKFEIFHDSVANINKIAVYSETYANNEYIPHTDVYSLPTSVLASKEINAVSKLSAFPIPTSTILNVMNPGNGANKIEVYDVSGKLVANKSFSTSENKISINVENLPKGTYIYKIGTQSSKFTKN